MWNVPVSVLARLSLQRTPGNYLVWCPAQSRISQCQMLKAGSCQVLSPSKDTDLTTSQDNSCKCWPPCPVKMFFSCSCSISCTVTLCPTLLYCVQVQLVQPSVTCCAPALCRASLLPKMGFSPPSRTAWPATWQGQRVLGDTPCRRTSTQEGGEDKEDLVPPCASTMDAKTGLSFPTPCLSTTRQGAGTKMPPNLCTGVALFDGFTIPKYSLWLCLLTLLHVSALGCHPGKYFRGLAPSWCAAQGHEPLIIISGSLQLTTPL